MADNRVYPEAGNVANWYASKSSAVTNADDVVIGTHIGSNQPGGVGFPSDFEDYTPVLRVDNPADGWNDGQPYVVYFYKTVDGARQLWKATNADPATLTQLTSGDEFDFANPYLPPLV